MTIVVGSVTIVVGDYAYHPARITLHKGARITFTNHDATAHTATTSTPGFDTGTMQPGQVRTITLTKSGTYNYYCQFHPFMHAQVTIANT